MNKEIKAKWVAALRSGEYKQGKGRLKIDGSYCCLGVLCDLYRKETGLGEWKKNEHDPRGGEWFLDEGGVLPAPVMDWAQINDPSGLLISEDNLTRMNDSGKFDFNQIADIIEKEL